MATIKDVAQRAGLSVSTVSRYLNKHPYISEEKKKRIQQAMDELNYVPSSIATQLRSKKGKTLGILVSRIANPFFAYLVDSIERHAKAQGYTVLVMQTYDDPHAEIQMLEMLKQKMVSGLIMCSIEGEIEAIEAYTSAGPILFCNEQVPNSKIPQIFTNQELAAYEATNYLIEQGYQRIAYCTGGSLTRGGHGNSRTAGFERALKAHELFIKKEWIFKEVHTIADGKIVAEKLLALPKEQRPTAIFTSSDEVATGIMETYLKAKQRVPEDLAILGFDNQPYTEVLSVPLTTIAQPVQALGEEATNLMIALLEEKSYTPNSEKLKLTLIIRESA